MFEEVMEKYRRVRTDREEVPDGIIRINRVTLAQQFIEQVIEELTVKNKDKVVLSSLGEAICKSVTIAEIVKHRVKGLHQVNDISTIVIDDEYEPIEDGLEKMTVQRKLTCLQITLQKEAPKTPHHGYQEPIPESEVGPDAGPEDDARRPQPRNRKRDTRSARPNDTPGQAAEENKTAEGERRGERRPRNP